MSQFQHHRLFLPITCIRERYNVLQESFFMTWVNRLENRLTCITCGTSFQLSNSEQTYISVLLEQLVEPWVHRLGVCCCAICRVVIGSLTNSLLPFLVLSAALKGLKLHPMLDCCISKTSPKILSYYARVLPYRIFMCSLLEAQNETGGVGLLQQSLGDWNSSLSFTAFL